MQLAGQHRQQPFFKTNTTSSTASSSYFLNFNTSAKQNGNQNMFSQCQSAPRTNFQPPNSAVSRQKESERETSQTTERLSALHNKLHQEAEKIRKWKTKTDLELNDKSKKLQDANMTIESQRKSIVELQLQNEKLSSKLQEELAGHVELDHKATATRELCNVLKDQVFRIDEAVASGEKDREELHFSEKQHLEQFQELVVKFQELEIQHSTKYNEMKDKLQKQHEKQLEFVSETKQCIEEKEKQIISLTEEKVEKEVKISTLVKDLGENREHLAATKREEGELKDRLKKSESILTSKDIQIKSVNEILVYTQEENKKLVGHICDRDRNVAQLQEDKIKIEQVFHEEQNQHKMKEQEFAANLKTLHQELDQCGLRIQELTCNLDTMTIDLESRKNENDIQKAENKVLREEVESMKASNEQLGSYQEELMEALQVLKSEKECLLKETTSLADKEKILQSAEETANKYIEDLEAKKNQLENEIEKNVENLDKKETLINNLKAEQKGLKRETDSMAEKIEKLESSLQNESANQDHMSSNLEVVQKEKEKLMTELEKTNNEVISLNQNIKALKKVETDLKKDVSKCAEKNKKLENEVTQLQQQLRQKNEEIEQKLDDDMNTTKSLQDELTSKEKELSLLENKTRTTQNQLTSKTKQIKDLQQEMKTMKTTAVTQTKKIKTLEKQNERAETEIQQTKTENEDLRNEIKALKEQLVSNSEGATLQGNELQNMKHEKEDSKKQIEILEAEMNKLTDCNEKTLKEKEESQACFDRERTDLCSTLENYKTENERILAQKERDLDHYKKKKEAELERHRKMIKEMREKLNCLTQARTADESLNNQVLCEKDEEINNLKQQIQELSVSKSPPIEKDFVAETPTRSQLVPSTPKTPRSILKQTDKPTKKRRVAFSSDQDIAYSSDEEDKNFKVFKTEPKKAAKNTASVIPTKVVRPNVRQSPGPVHQPIGLLKKSPTLRKIKKKESPKGALHNEMEKFKELFPDMAADMTKEKTTSKGKKTPFKSRITKISPKKTTEADVDWFDNDAFFGFDG